MRVVFLGPQGVGKGTQAALLGARLGVPALSTGDMLRAEVKAGTPLGKEANAIMKRGDLVPDGIMLGMIKKRISEPDAAKGFILDGFPRNIAQAEGLDSLLAEEGKPINAAIRFRAPRELLLKRLSGRRSCPTCGAVYNMETNPPKRDEVCDRDGTPLVQRADDSTEAINKRLDIYVTQTKPLSSYYEDKGVLREVDGTRTIDQVHDDVAAALGLTAAPAKVSAQ